MKRTDPVETNNLLKNLIKEAIRAKGVPWLTSELVDTDDFKITRSNGRSLPVRQVLSIYQTRAAIAKEMGIDVRGYDWVLENLAQSPDGQVEIIHMVDGDEFQYLVFVSPPPRKLLGVVRFPPRESAV